MILRILRASIATPAQDRCLERDLCVALMAANPRKLFRFTRMPALASARQSPLLAYDPLAPLLVFLAPVSIAAVAMHHDKMLGPVTMAFAVTSLPFLGAVVCACVAFVLTSLCSHALAGRSPDAAATSYALSLPLAALTLVGVAEVVDVVALVSEAHLLDPATLAALILVGIMSVATAGLSVRTGMVVRGEQ